MTIDDSHNSPVAQAAIMGDDLTRLAQQALAVLAVHGPGRSDGMARRLERLKAAYLSPDEDKRHDMLAQIRQDGVSINDLIDHVVPAIARILGEEWANDTISFADVTIGTARLQETVRSLGWRHDSRNRIAADAPVILLIIPRPEHHTLGTFNLADQFRRLGYRVDIAIDQHPRQIMEMLQNKRYVMIGITAAGRRTLASATELVDMIRQTVTRAAPVVIGGSILDRDLDVLALTGADHTARDAVSALRKSGIFNAGLEPPQRAFAHAGAKATGYEE
jgi:methanogenic corrinoid protein MtbC1